MIKRSIPSTDFLPEGANNLYHTTARAAAAAPVQRVAGKQGNVSLTKADVGLGNVDNTADLDKPVSNAVADELGQKADASELTGKADLDHGHEIADVAGLQTALDEKADDSHNHAIADVIGLQTALDGKLAISGARERLTGNRTYFVRVDGNDSNDGLTDSSGGAFLTIQRAYDAASALDPATFSVTISIGAGTFAGVVINRGYSGTVLAFVGQGASTIISATTCFSISGLPSVVSIASLALVSTGSGIVIRGATQRLNILTGVIFGACTNYHIRALNGALVTVSGNQEINGNSARHASAEVGAFISFEPGTTTVTGTPAFSVGFCVCTMIAGITFLVRTFSGAATGTRYLVQSNGVINTGGAAVTYIPGSVAGSATTGGQYL
jgi:hypothetical protein